LNSNVGGKKPASNSLSRSATAKWGYLLLPCGRM
jgi:hypothetical protein